MAARRNEVARSAVHDTIVIVRTFSAPPALVFEAWRSVEAREVWSVPAPGIEIVFEQADFREGGVDVSRCGAKGDLKYLATVRYADIVPDHRLVMVEEVSADGMRLSVALLTITLTAQGQGTRLDFVAQVAALDGSDMVQGYHDGWTGAFNNLDSYLARGAAA